jgi:hypothetical protein
MRACPLPIDEDHVPVDRSRRHDIEAAPEVGISISAPACERQRKSGGEPRQGSIRTIHVSLTPGSGC